MGPEDSESRSPSGDQAVSRADFLRAGALGGAALALGAAPAAARRRGVAPGAARPALTHGVQSGDVTARSAVVWARADRPSRMLVELASTERFSSPRRVRGPRATRDTDLTAQIDLRGLPPGSEVHYRVRFERLDAPGAWSEPQRGSFRTAPRRRRDLSFVWGGDVAGQGWGINPEFGGYRMFETMRRADPDFFIHSGDTIYADGPLEERVALPDGSVWRNVVTDEKAKVAQTLAEFRGNHAYNRLDDNLRRFSAQVPVFAQWDDHETYNNWWPGEIIDDPRYRERRADVLAARGRRAFLEYHPIRGQHRDDDRIYRVVRHGPSLDVFFLDMRESRGPNPTADEPSSGTLDDLLGPRQLRWLQRELRRSRATWKVIAAGLPLGLVVPDGPHAVEAVAQSDGRPLAREQEIARLLSFIRRFDITNTVWVTADVHYAAAHHYDPSRARFQNFRPFWEFVAGPLHAGTFGPNALDDTFGPEVRFQRAADRPNQPPSEGLQFFGHASIAGDTEVMTVGLRDLSGRTLYEVALEPEH